MIQWESVRDKAYLKRNIVQNQCIVNGLNGSVAGKMLCFGDIAVNVLQPSSIPRENMPQTNKDNQVCWDVVKSQN